MKELDRNYYKVGKDYLFDELWDGNGDGKELFESCEIALFDSSLDGEVIVSFSIKIKDDECFYKSLVTITNIENS